jgi:hypothetical protein
MWKFEACKKCRGDLVVDNEDWRCFQCGAYYYPWVGEAKVSQPALNRNTEAPMATRGSHARPKACVHPDTDFLMLNDGRGSCIACRRDSKALRRQEPKITVDDGCEHSPSCLTCPFEFCVHDDPKKFLMNRRVESWSTSMIAGELVEAAAARLGIDVRTIFRRQAQVQKKAMAD